MSNCAIGALEGSPEQEEPPDAVGQEFAHGECPCLFVADALQERHLGQVFFCGRGGLRCFFFFFILFDVCQFGFVHPTAFAWAFVEEHPESHPYEA